MTFVSSRWPNPCIPNCSLFVVPSPGCSCIVRTALSLSLPVSHLIASRLVSSAKALVLAVMPRDSSNGVAEANAFLDHVQTTYPETADHWQALDSEHDFVDMMNGEDYASDTTAGFSFGIVFSSGSPDFEYKAGTVPGTAVVGCMPHVFLCC